MYLFARLVERFTVEVIPGVSSLTACAAVLGAPLAARNDTLAVVPAPLEADELARRLDGVDAAAIIKVGRHLPKVRGVLVDLGLADRARYVERATMENQRVLPLADVSDGDAPYFSMILVHRRAEAWR
jgi:precorrin-2/cobalt-factor-2 C20-methyltransferase